MISDSNKFERDKEEIDSSLNFNMQMMNNQLSPIEKSPLSHKHSKSTFSEKYR